MLWSKGLTNEMKYKAVCHIPGRLPGGEIKALQVLGDSYATVSAWASKMLDGAAVGTRVDVYEVTEVLKHSFTKKEKGQD